MLAQKIIIFLLIAGIIRESVGHTVSLKSMNLHSVLHLEHTYKNGYFLFHNKGNRKMNTLFSLRIPFCPKID